MKGALVPVRGQILGERAPPAIGVETDKAAVFAYAEFFGAEIDRAYTYWAYRHAVDGFLAWCTAR